MAYTIFLDRDGVINQDSSEYIKNETEFKFIPQSPEAISLLTQSGLQVILITNQSLIGRKMASIDTLRGIFKKMTAGVESVGGEILDIFYCPHLPSENCDCRKPEPGLIFQAKEKHDIVLHQSCMVGDSAKDIECALNAGCAKTVLVGTGNGEKALIELKAKGISPDFFAQNLYEAARWLIENVATTRLEIKRIK